MVKTENFILRYTNCWEDTEVLLKYIDRGPGANYISIASGGDNSLSLLCLDPTRVHVVDINPLQLFLLELKKAAIQMLDWESCKAFLGYCSSDSRWQMYQQIKSVMSLEAQQYWAKNPSKINQGIIHSGIVATNFRFFANYIRPLIHSKKTCANLLSDKSEANQQYFYNQHWDNTRWRIIFKLFFSNSLLKVITPDPDFFNYVKEDVSTYLYNRTRKMFQSHWVQNNPVAHYALLGQFGNCLHHYMQAENFELIKQRIDRLTWETGFIQAPIQRGLRFDGFNLSNIFEYTTPTEFDDLAQVLTQGGNTNARYVYWNILLPRQLSASSKQLQLIVNSAEQADFKDKVWLYSRCLVEEKK